MAVITIRDVPQTSQPPVAEHSDGALLRQFLEGSEVAFGQLVQRHTALVLGVCRRTLQRQPDADDAFQAVFLVLARKARTLVGNESLAAWLHETAWRTALKLRGTLARRQGRERSLEPDSGESREIAAATLGPDSKAAWREVSEILDAELAALPVSFREVIVLSQLEGLTRDQVAERLEISPASVKDRLERGRDLLRSRLLKRGVTLGVASLAAWLVPSTASAATTSLLVQSTTHAAGAFALGSTSALASPTAIGLAEGVLQMTILTKLKLTALTVMGLLTAGGVAYAALRDDPQRFQQGLRGQVIAIETQGQARITVQLDEFDTPLNLDIARDAQVMTAFEPGSLQDVRTGQYVSLRLAADHRTVAAVHVRGEVRQAAVAFVPPTGKIRVTEETDEEGQVNTLEVDFAPDAIMRIGGLPATRRDLRPGMSLPLEFGRSKQLVHAIEAEAPEHAIIEGELTGVDSTRRELTVASEATDDSPGGAKTYQLDDKTILLLGDQPGTTADLQPGRGVRLRLLDNGRTVSAVQIDRPEPEEMETADAADDQRGDDGPEESDDDRRENQNEPEDDGRPANDNEPAERDDDERGVAAPESEQDEVRDRILK